MSEDSTLDRRLPAPRTSRGTGIYVAYTIAGALLLGAGALSLGHLSSYRPSAAGQPALAGQAVAQLLAQATPAPPAVLAQVQPPAQPPAPATAPSTTVRMPSVTVKMPEPPSAAAPPPPAAPATAAAPSTTDPQPTPTAPTPTAPTTSAPTPSVAAPPVAAPSVAAPAPPPAAPVLPATIAPPPPAASPGSGAQPPASPTAAADADDAPINLIAANGLPLPPPEKPPVPGRRVGKCPVGTDAADMIEAGPAGRLPRVAGNGCMPWLAYASDFDHLDRERPRLGMAVIGIGLNEPLTQKAVETLPPGATLVFMPETPNLDRWIQRARERGLEALLMLPSLNPQGAAERGMPPLQKGLAPAENMRRLHAVLARATGYVGVALLPNPMLEDSATLRPLLQEIRDRGLLVLEFERWNGKSLVHSISRELGIPYSTDIDSPIAWVDRFNANGRETTAADVDAGLVEVEKYARAARFGLGWSLARPLAIDRIAAWAPGARTRGILLAPVTGVTECSEICQQRLLRAMQSPAPAAAAR